MFSTPLLFLSFCFQHPSGVWRERPPIHSRQWLGAILVLLLAQSPLVQSRPMISEDAAVLERGECQFESWLEHQSDNTSLWLSPGCYLAPGLEASLTGARQLDSDGGSVFGWQIKYRLNNPPSPGPDFALVLGNEHDRSSPARGALRNPLLMGVASVPLDDASRMAHVNLGVIRDRDNRHTHGYWTLAVEQGLGENTHVSAELVQISGDRAQWQVGWRRDLLSGRLQLDSSLGSAIGEWSENRFMNLGIVVALPGFRH